MSVNNPLQYTINNQSLFANAEPYHYGSGSPNIGYFMPIGEDDLPTTDDFKIQLAEDNKYSKLQKLEAFRINNNPIIYIEAGTFPLLNKVIDTNSNQVAAGTYEFATLKITYDSAGKITTVIFYTYTRNTNDVLDDLTNIENVPTTLYDREAGTGRLIDLKHGNEEVPLRLGFILVGGGGGAGGGGRFDPDKNKKGSSGDYVIPGGGGGGGETLYGVLDISYEAAKKIRKQDAPTELTYYVAIGNGGYSGSHNISDKAASGGHAGGNGGDGTASRLFVQCPDPNNPETAKATEILRAEYGGQGYGAKDFTFGTAGVGGKAREEGPWACPENIAYIAQNYNCIVIDTIPGCKGGHPVDGSETSVENDSLAFSIYFSNTAPPSDPKYMLTCNHNSESQTYSTGSNTSGSVFKTPGGHSFGAGASSNAAPKHGGGGGCFETNYRAGAGGYFGLYY